jgi:peptide/nickel transport system permease protein
MLNLLKDSLDRLLSPRARLADLPGLVDLPPAESSQETPIGVRRMVRPRDVIFNSPLLFGSLIVLGLFLVVLFGPLWAPSNPYIAGQHIVPHYDPVADEWISPPLTPSEEYPLGTDEWGNDIFSMLLYGARTTLIASAFITMVRVILGLVLGAIAGWNQGGLSDQVIMGLIGLITSVPMLISSMILIFALDIRRGLPVFILALAAIGWTEIAQYIRSEFLVLRQMPFIEGARAVGAGNLAVAVRHILPNLLPQLLVITFLEVGAVLMLLGELGFVGVYIGGGSRTALGDELSGIQIVTLIEAPEWGAMLAQGYRWLRAKPFIVFPPAIAFFTAVVGFNSLGEGLRRLLETTHVNTNFLLRKRMVLVIAALTMATVFIINNTGPAPWFNKVARAFNGTAAYEHVASLAAMEGRGLGQAGGEQAAAYIAEKFEAYGLRPGWAQSQYHYNREILLVEPLAQPELTLLAEDGIPLHTFHHQLDFGFVTAGHGGSGRAEASLVFVGFTAPGQPPAWESFKGLDLRDRIVLLIEGNAPRSFVTEAQIRGARGVVWISGEAAAAIRSQNQIRGQDEPYLQEPTLPVFRVRETVGLTLLAQDNLAVADLLVRPEQPAQSGPGWFVRPLSAAVRLDLQLSEPRPVAVPSVLGFLPGSDFQIANELIVLFATYDGLGIDPDGTTYPAVNESAAGVGLLLEMARLWQEQELNPRRTVMFVAWGGGQLEYPGAREFLESNLSFRYLPAQANGNRLAPLAIFELGEVGAGKEKLFLNPNANSRLLALTEEIAGQIDLPVTTEISAAPPTASLARAERVPWLPLSWEGAVPAPDQDTLDRIQVEKLEAMGQTLSLALTKMVREASY